MRNFGAQTPLFRSISWYQFSQSRFARMQAEIDAINENEFLNMAALDLEKYLVERYNVEIPEIDEAGITADQTEMKFTATNGRGYDFQSDSHRASITGVKINVSIPFSGNPELLQVQPSTSPSDGTPVAIGPGTLEVEFQEPYPNADQIRQRINRLVDAIKGNLDNLKRDIAGFNNQLTSIVNAHISQRRQRLLGNRQLVESLGFSIKRRPDAVALSPRVVKKRVTPVRPVASAGAYKPEPALEVKAYEEILVILENMVLVMERTPAAFTTLDEPSLRMHFLVQLNGQYEGQATGETFNYSGKTDILIRAEGRNIFIAECKFWTGPAGLAAAIDQLLGYASWRDTKVGVLVFNRNKDFTAVVESADTTMKVHPNFKRELGKRSETSFRYLFKHKDDANRELTLTLMCFDVPR